MAESKYFKQSKIIKISRDSSKKIPLKYRKILREIGWAEKEKVNREKVLLTRPTAKRLAMYQKILEQLTYWNSQKADYECRINSTTNITATSGK